MLYRDVLGGDTLEIGSFTLVVGERSDYQIDQYCVPLSFPNGAQPLFAIVGKECRLGSVVITARPRTGRLATLGIEAPREVRIHVTQSQRWQETRRRRAS